MPAKKANIVRLADRLTAVDLLVKFQLLFDRAKERLDEAKETVRKFAVENYVEGATSLEILGEICGVPVLVKFPEPSRVKSVEQVEGEQVAALVGTAWADKLVKKVVKVVYEVDVAQVEAYLEANPDQVEAVNKLIPVKAGTPSVTPPKIDDNVLAAIEKAQKKAVKAQGAVQQVAQ